MDSEAVSSGADLGLKIFEMLIPVILAGLGWITKKVADLINAKAKNEYLRGTMTRLNESVFDAVKAVNQRSAVLLAEFRDEDSDGGEKITKKEAEMLKQAALDHVKAYWGKKGLKEMGKVLGFGGFLGLFGKDEAGMEKMISDKIEAAVHDVKAAKANPKQP